MTHLEYWTECIAVAAEECGLSLTDEQLECLAGGVVGGHENYGMAFGHDVASRNLTAAREREVKDLKASVERERRKITCRACNGHGFIRMEGWSHYSDMECHKCHGEGRHDP